jgi:hypothetical protein
VITRNLFASLRTKEKNKETTGAENTLPEKQAPRKSDRPPSIAMNSTTNLIRLQRGIKNPVKGEYELRNRNENGIVTKK